MRQLSSSRRFRRSPLVLAALLAVGGFLSGCPSQDGSISGGAGAAGDARGQRPSEDPELVAQRERMVAQLAKTVNDARLLDAFRRVPRHLFVPDALRERAYEVGTSLPISENQTVVSPEYVAIMTDALDLKGHEKVLEIGTGSGYQAAVLGELVDEVYTMEIVPRLAVSARERLARLKRDGLLGYKKIEVIEDNGYEGYPPAAKYDAIIVTAAPRTVPVPLLNQLKVGGRMVVPIGDFYQELQVITRRSESELDSTEKEVIQTVRFERMVGAEGK